MNRNTYLDLAASGVRMPIGTDLVLHERDDVDAILMDGARLGAVIAETARRYRTPIALPLMDLMVEKAEMLAALAVPTDEVGTYHYGSAPPVETADQLRAGLAGPLTRRLQANVDAVNWVSRNTDLVPCGLTIGPFSLMTKLLSDPIGPIYAAGAGVSADDDPEVLAVERCLALALETVKHSLRAHIAAGAKLMAIAEPAANVVYMSPRQLAKGSDIFERLVMRPNREIRRLLADAGVDLMLHDCGVLTDPMLKELVTLDPAILSLGSSRTLWEDAAIVPEDVVLYGNLPTKRFFEEDLTETDVAEQACETIQRVRATGHAHILGSECDVLSVPGKHEQISRKVDVFMNCDGC